MPPCPVHLDSRYYLRAAESLPTRSHPALSSPALLVSWQGAPRHGPSSRSRCRLHSHVEMHGATTTYGARLHKQTRLRREPAGKMLKASTRTRDDLWSHERL